MRVSLVGLGVCCAVGVSAFACGPGKAPEVPGPPSVDEVRQELEDAIVEKLTCDERLRPSTLERLRDVLDGADPKTLQALLLNPQDLASVVALGGAQVEAPVIVGRNLLRIVSDGTARDLVDHGWDGVSCGEAVPLSCTAGETATVVDCDANGAADVVTLSFDLCTLGGTVLDGEVRFVRLADDGVDGGGTGDELAALSFDGFTLNEVRALDGALVLDVGRGADTFAAQVASDEAFAFVEHGGLASGLECASQTSFSSLALQVNDVDDDTAFVKMGASRATPDVTVGIETFGEHLRFGDPTACACPLPGSGALIDVPRPLGRPGETGRARVTWERATDDALCSQPTVELVTWPTDCEPGESGVDVDGDCARAATEDTLAGVLGALCAR